MLMKVSKIEACAPKPWHVNLNIWLACILAVKQVFCSGEDSVILWRTARLTCDAGPAGALLVVGAQAAALLIVLHICDAPVVHAREVCIAVAIDLFGGVKERAAVAAAGVVTCRGSAG